MIRIFLDNFWGAVFWPKGRWSSYKPVIEGFQAEFGCGSIFSKNAKMNFGIEKSKIDPVTETQELCERKISDLQLIS